MNNIPKEFQEYGQYYNAAINLKRYNPIVSLVLTHVFIDNCQDIVLSSQTSESARNFLDKLKRNLPSFPRAGCEEVKIMANDLFISLRKHMREGNITSNIANQLWICNVLYSILNGDEAIKRERICKIAAVRINRLLGQLKKKNLHKQNPPELHKPTEKPNAKPNPTKKHHSTIPQNLPSKQTQPADDNHKVHRKRRIKPSVSLDSLLSNFDESNALSYLSSLGVKVPTSVPQLNHKTESSILQNLELSLSSIAKNDYNEAKNLLYEAKNIWKSSK